MTNFGKTLRKLRIDHNERLYDMAKKLSVSSAFLSAVENGKKGVPNSWIERIATGYGLDSDEEARLQQEANEAALSVKIDLGNASAQQRSVATGFARRFNEFSEETLEEFRKLLENNKDWGGTDS